MWMNDGGCGEEGILCWGVVIEEFVWKGVEVF